MKETRLFKSRDGAWVTTGNILAALAGVGADQCQVLFMHTALSFGMPHPQLSKQELLAALLETITELGVPTICVPTFTFSFCNGEDYDVARSRSRMGILNEYIRKLDSATRSIDPLLSVALLGEDRDLVEGLGHHSIGTDSTFDKLHHKRGVTFLFFGASLSECFTYTHYVEERESVPYRYNRDFSGLITNGERVYRDTYTLFVRYKDVIPATEGRFERFLLAHGLLRKAPCGDGWISCIDEPVAHEAIVGRLRSNIDYFLAKPYPRDHLDKEFKVHDMVAL